MNEQPPILPCEVPPARGLPPKPILAVVAFFQMASVCMASGNFLLLPVSAPAPTARPQLGCSELCSHELEDRGRLPNYQEPTQGTAQPVHPTRRNIRVVGTKYLPDPSETIELKGETAARARDIAKPEDAQ